MLSLMPQDKPVVFTVSQLNAQIKGLLESAYPMVWVKGEISNFKIPASGHYYFTLKDELSQIRAVFFRPQHRHLRFVPEGGLQVLCQGRVSVYEPRGEYQLIVEIMEPQGLGALQLAFEQLKKKLEAEGLFDPRRKRPLPARPQRIAIVTSPTGAAIRDILKVLQHSPYPITVTLLPSRVQGQEAAAEIAAAIETAGRLAPRFQWDLLVAGRGGGSIEDLWPFNEEIVARALAACPIPTISAVGHEIDFTIADMVTDHRAPTPTAAAQWIVGQQQQLERELTGREDILTRNILRRIEDCEHRLGSLEKRLSDPRRRLADLRLYVDDRLERIQLAITRQLEKWQTARHNLAERMDVAHPARRLVQYRSQLEQARRALFLHQQRTLHTCGFQLQKWSSQLDSLSPLGVLGRGYSITYRLPARTIVRRSNDVAPGDDLLVQLGQGRLECQVKRTIE